MKSIREIFRIGKGPSSSHTLGPRKATLIYLEQHPEAREFKVELFGSLAATGKGHLTDVAIIEAVEEGDGRVDIVWNSKTYLTRHPNAMTMCHINAEGKEVDKWTFYSVGGGALECDEYPIDNKSEHIYHLNYMTQLMKWCNHTGKTYWEYVGEHEDAEFWDWLTDVWNVMKASIERGIDKEGVLPGPLNLRRKSSSYYIRALGFEKSLQSRGLVYAYVLGVCEENASGGVICAAPTCGSCGIIPGVLYHLQKEYNFTDKRIVRALATAGLVGNVVKQNASISGAEVGCQGEVGVACAMAAAASMQLMGGSPAQIEYAAEMGLEHHLGMTCDPVGGLVQIPCIERNAYGAARALDAYLYASYSDGRHRVSFDQVVEVMKQTGKDLPSLYKETAEGGLALYYEQFD